MSQPRQKCIDVVAGLVFERQCLLVCQRHPNQTFPLKWEFPGGKVEQGESSLDALKRELREELDVEVRQSREVFSYRHIYPGVSEVNLKFFQVHKYDGQIKNLVFNKISWVRIEALSRLDFLDGDLPLIRRLLSSEEAKLLS
jgi:8-oxo-dGTP diphosphatase